MKRLQSPKETQMNEHCFPRLAKLAKSKLCIPATQIRLYSKAGSNSLKPTTNYKLFHDS